MSDDAEKTKRTRIRCRTILLAMLLALAALTAGTYIHARYDAFTIAIAPDGHGGASAVPGEPRAGAI